MSNSVDNPATLHTRAILNTEDKMELAARLPQLKQRPFDEVAKETGLHRDILRKLVRAGKIPGVAALRQPEVGTCDIEAAQAIARRLEAARCPVDGTNILVTKAAEKYRFSRKVVYEWIRNEWVRPVGTTENGDLLINEGDVAFAYALAEELGGHKRGKPVFPTKHPVGRPPRQ